MELVTNIVGIEDLQPGDHIYTWRAHYTYAHHGIYMGDGEVIHFRGGKGGGSSSRSWSREEVQCDICDINVKTAGVSKCCLGCFLEGRHAHLYRYGASRLRRKMSRRGTCTVEEVSDPSDVMHRAEYLLNHDVGFGQYHLLDRNCEDFALYCSLGIVGVGQGISGQVSPLMDGKPLVRRIEVEDLVFELQNQYSDDDEDDNDDDDEQSPYNSS